MTHFPANKRIFALFFLVAMFMICSEAAAVPKVGVMPAPSWIVAVTPSGPRPSPKEYSEGYYLSFWDKQVNLDKKTTYTKVVREIVTESGIQNGSAINIAFDPSYEQVNFHYINVWRDGKPVSRLKLSEMKVLPEETDRQRFIYNGNYSASIALPDIRKGDKIEFAYSRTGWNPVFQGKYSANFVFGSYDYISHVHYALLANDGRQIYFKDFNKPPVKSVKRENSLQIYEWERKGNKHVIYEDYAPNWLEKEPSVQISEFKDWAEVVHWGLQFYQVPEASSAIKLKAAEFKKAAQSDVNYLELATRFVQDEIRYLGIETGENSHKPHNPDQVMAQRYGDCKDKAFLLCALLKAGGFDCDPVLIDTFRRGHMVDCLPSPAVFNHVVVMVRLEKRLVFIDATYSLQGGKSSTIFFPAYGAGLPLNEKINDVVEIPLQNSGSVEITEEFFLPSKNDTTGQGNMMVKTVYFEGEADNIRSSFQQGNLSDTEESYMKYYQGVYKKMNFRLLDTLEYYDQREANNFSVVERYGMTNMWQYDSTRKNEYFTVSGSLMNDQLLRLPAGERKSPLGLHFPYKLRYKILLRSAIVLTMPDEHWEVKRDSYEMGFKVSFNEAEKAWELVYEYETLKDNVPVAQVAQYKADVEKFAKNLEFEFRNNESGLSDSGDTNYYMIFLRMVSLLLGIAGCVWLYRYSPGGQYAHGTGLALGGWLVFLGFSVIGEPLILLVSLFDSDSATYFSTKVWDLFLSDSALKLYSFRFALALECVFNSLLFCASILLIFLFFKKRDSFVRIFSLYFAVKILFLIADAVIVAEFVQPENHSNETMATVGKLIIFSAIWISYLHISDRSHNTFINVFAPEKLPEAKGDEVADSEIAGES